MRLEGGAEAEIEETEKKKRRSAQTTRSVDLG